MNTHYLTDEDIGRIKDKERKDTIEECAQVAESWIGMANPPSVAAAIRALKDKP